MSTLRVARGDSIELDIEVKQTNGQPQDLAGATLRFTAKTRLGDADVDAAIAGSTVDGRIVVTDAVNGKAHVSIPGSVTEAWTADRTLHWDIQVRAGAVTKTLDSGLLIVRRDVTRTSP